MTKYLDDKRVSLMLVVVCFITYTIIGLTRNAYSAAIAGIISEGYFTKFYAGVIGTSFNITYCLSQIVGSYFVDKVSPFKIIILGITVTIVANVVMSINPTFWVIFIARAVCGVAQFGIWPALLRILSEFVNESHRKTWRYILPLGITSGSILSYLAAAVFTNWRSLFTLSYVSMAIMAVVFVVTSIYAGKKAVTREAVKPEVKTAEPQKEHSTISTGRLLVMSGAIFLIFPTFARSLINGAINSWLPTMIMESYGVSSQISSVLTTISTAANLAAVFWVVILYPRIFKLQTTAMGMFFVFTVPLLILASFIGTIPMLLMVVLMTIVNTFKNSIHQFNTVEIPMAYTKYNKAGMVAGLINAFATGAGIFSGLLWGWMAEWCSWNVIVASWAVLSLLSAVCCFVATPFWKKLIKGEL